MVINGFHSTFMDKKTFSLYMVELFHRDFMDIKPFHSIFMNMLPFHSIFICSEKTMKCP